MTRLLLGRDERKHLTVSVDVPFFFVDVFAGQPLTGNPLALVPHADAIDESRMRAIAREFNQSETTFIVSPTTDRADRRLRSFTPAGIEVFGAGHNAMGAWLWLAQSGELPAARQQFVQQIGDDLLNVHVQRADGPDGAIVTMDQSPPRFGETADDRDELAAALGLQSADLDAATPAQVVSTGAGHLLVPVIDRAAVDRAVPDSPRLLRVLRASGGEGCYLYSVERTADPNAPVAYTRFFNPTVGIAEDPATGTAAGPLVALLVRDGIVADATPATVEQGTSLGRPSHLRVTVTGDRVTLSGTGVIAASGSLHLAAESSR